jgi:hypothetical protein
MAAYSKEQTDFYKSEVRKELAIRPDISERLLADRLASKGYSLARKYVAKLRNKVVSEIGSRIDRSRIATYLGHYDEAVTQAVEQQWAIANDPTTSKLTRKMALDSVVQHLGDRIDRLAMYGVFDKGDVRSVRSIPVTQEKQDAWREMLLQYQQPAIEPVKMVDPVPIIEAKPHEPEQPAQKPYSPGAVTQFPGGTATVRYGINAKP